MTNWVISVVCIALLTVICDVILADGETKKYINTVIAIVISFVLVQPIVNFALPNVVQSFDNQAIQVQKSYIDDIADRKLEQLQNLCTEELKNNNLTNVQLKIDDVVKTVKVELGCSYSQTVYDQVCKIVSKYFDGYKIDVFWSE